MFWCGFCNKGVFFRKFQTFGAATPIQGGISAVNSNFCIGSYNGCLMLAVCCYRCTVVRVDKNDCLANLCWFFGTPGDKSEHLLNGRLGWTDGPVCTFFREQNILFLAGNRSPDCPVRSLVSILTALFRFVFLAQLLRGQVNQ